MLECRIRFRRRCQCRCRSQPPGPENRTMKSLALKILCTVLRTIRSLEFLKDDESRIRKLTISSSSCCKPPTPPGPINRNHFIQITPRLRPGSALQTSRHQVQAPLSADPQWPTGPGPSSAKSQGRKRPSWQLASLNPLSAGGITAWKKKTPRSPGGAVGESGDAGELGNYFSSTCQGCDENIADFQIILQVSSVKVL